MTEETKQCDDVAKWFTTGHRQCELHMGHDGSHEYGRSALVAPDMSDEKKDQLKKDIMALPPLPILDNVTALMRQPEDAPKYQEVLKAWADEQISRLIAERDMAQENLDKAHKMKVSTAGWKRQVRLWDGRVTYYKKILSAINQGYFIMPDLPNVIDIFAVRTDQKNTNQVADSTWQHSVRLDDVKSKTLPEGEGRYVHPQPDTESFSEQETYEDRNGEEQTRTRYFMAATGIDECVDFPIKAVRPQVLDEVGKALARKMFDELGVITPHRGSARRGDPIVVGRILRREGRQDFGCSFIVHWWVDTRDL